MGKAETNDKIIASYNRMFDALKTIARGYQTPQQLQKNANKQYGLTYLESLEMAYENIQSLAYEATRKVRRFRPKSNSDMQSNGASQGTMTNEQNPDNQKS